jgi:two-component system response regulator YesN
MKVLVVDDEPIELLNISHILSTFDHSVEIRQAENGMEAFQLLTEDLADIVFLDIRMAGWSGLETLDRIKTKWPKLKVAMVSAYGEFQYAKTAMEYGVSGYILKPVVPDELIKVYVNLCKEIEAEKEIDPIIIQAFVEQHIHSNTVWNERHPSTWTSQMLIKPTMLLVFKMEDIHGVPIEKYQWEERLTIFATAPGILIPRPILGYWIYLLEAKEVQIIKDKCSDVKLQWKLINPDYIWSYGIGTWINSPKDLKKSFFNAIQSSKEAEESVIQQCINCITERYAESFSLNDLAAEVHLSPSHLSRIFKKGYGLTFIDVLTKVRIEKAKELLNNPHLTIEFIADQVGFGSPNYFAVTFKKSLGLSPSQYRITLMGE